MMILKHKSRLTDSEWDSNRDGRSDDVQTWWIQLGEHVFTVQESENDTNLTQAYVGQPSRIVWWRLNVGILLFLFIKVMLRWQDFRLRFLLADLRIPQGRGEEWSLCLRYQQEHDSCTQLEGFSLQPDSGLLERSLMLFLKCLTSCWVGQKRNQIEKLISKTYRGIQGEM